MALDPPSPEPPPSSSSSGVDLGLSRSPADHPEPGSSVEVAIQIGQLDFGKPSEERSALDLGSGPSRDEEARLSRRRSEVSWPFVILGSYASAVTLALIWILATGKMLPRFQAEAPAPRIEARPAVSPRLADAIPPDRAASLGKSLVVGDLEIMPLMVLRKTIRIPEGVGSDRRDREIHGCLALTIRLKNTSKDRPLTPLGPPGAQSGAPEQSPYLEMGTGQRVPMLELSMSNERSFPTIAPNAVADIVMVSEPVPSARLVGPLTWWISLKTGGEELKTIGVRFSRGEVDEVGG